jgi:hypothetical protein
MHKKHDPNQLIIIEAFIDQIKDAVSLAGAANTPCMPAQIVSIAYSVMFSTRMFPEACRKWRRCPTIEETESTSN